MHAPTSRDPKEPEPLEARERNEFSYQGESMEFAQKLRLGSSIPDISTCNMASANAAASLGIEDVVYDFSRITMIGFVVPS